MKKVRCAIYTRKSSENGLEQDFNSLDAQREACSAYIDSQKGEGWFLLPNHYDDGGISGGTLDRPALEALLTDVEERQVDQIVVYKIDRLTRSMADFAKLVERLDKAGVSFVSVTQSFNTATSMGRLTLNVLLSFAQFEREVTAERIRDKIAASKKKGLWMGGHVPLGYDADGRTLKINEQEAKTVRRLFDLYLELGTIKAVNIEAEHLGLHSAIIQPDVWEEVQRKLETDAAHGRGRRINAKEPSLLIGKLFDETGDRLTPSPANKNEKRYRYYVSQRLIKQSGESDNTGWRIPAKQLERAVIDSVSGALVGGTIAKLMNAPSADEVSRAAHKFSDLKLKERAPSLIDKVVKLVKKIEVTPGQMNIELGKENLADTLNIYSDRLNEDALQIQLPFQFRKRGVETRLVFGAITNQVDAILVRNIARANSWFDAIKSGQTFDEIDEHDQTSKRRIQQIIKLAFLAPDIVRAVVEGKQPIGLTSDWLLRHDLPVEWRKQRELIATL